jgi:hypothetical protein
MVHPGEYHGVYLKRLVPGANDVNIASATLPTTIAPDALFSLHVTRVAGVVHVTLTSAALPSPVTLTGSEEGPPNEGRMGLVWSPTTSDTGAVFTDVVVTSATCPSAATDGGAMDAGADTGVPGPLEPYSNGPSAPGPGPNNANGQPWTIAFDEEWNGTYGNDRRTDLGGWTAEHWGYPFTETKNGTLNAGSNVWVQGGLLNLATTGSNGTQGSGTGGYVSTCITDGAVTPFDFTHGYFEAYVFLPGSGATIDNWPAWWAVGDNINWPSGGEIDVAEGLGTNCWHWHDPSGGPGGCPSGSFGGTWHYYGASWYPSGSGQGVTWYYDGISVGSLTSSIASHEMCLILENDNGGGGPTVDSVMQVDYVRLWQ